MPQEEIYIINNRITVEVIYKNGKSVVVTKSNGDKIEIDSVAKILQSDENKAILILTEIKNNKFHYVYILNDLIKFTTLHEITYFDSLYGRDDFDNYYLLSNFLVIVPGEMIENFVIDVHNQMPKVYQFYVKKRIIHLYSSTDTIIGTETIFDGAIGFCLNGRRFNLLYEPNAADDYDKLIGAYGIMEIEKDGERIKIEKNDYINLMNTWSAINNIHPIIHNYSGDSLYNS